MKDTLIEQGLNLMLFGMGTVFIFLTILIFATGAMSSVINRFFPEKAAVTPSKKKPVGQAATSIPPSTLKILQAAIDKHRDR